MKTDNLPDFSGKTVSFYPLNDECPAIFENPQFEMQGNRLFVKGIVPKGTSGGDWLEGVECAVAWKYVVRYYVFPSPEDYISRENKAPKDEED